MLQSKSLFASKQMSKQTSLTSLGLGKKTPGLSASRENETEDDMHDMPI